MMVFQTQIAATLFGTPPAPETALAERRLLDGALDLIASGSPRNVFRAGPQLDAMLQHLSGVHLLEMARALEEKSPAVIDNMPRLRAVRAQVVRAIELAAIFSEHALDLMAKALAQAKADHVAGSLGGPL